MSAWGEGLNSAASHDPRGERANPYERGSEKYLEWQRGYYDYVSAAAEMNERNEDEWEEWEEEKW